MGNVTMYQFFKFELRKGQVMKIVRGIAVLLFVVCLAFGGCAKESSTPAPTPGDPCVTTTE